MSIISVKLSTKDIEVTLLALRNHLAFVNQQYQDEGLSHVEQIQKIHTQRVNEITTPIIKLSESISQMKRRPGKS